MQDVFGKEQANFKHCLTKYMYMHSGHIVELLVFDLQQALWLVYVFMLFCERYHHRVSGGIGGDRLELTCCQQKHGDLKIT